MGQFGNFIMGSDVRLRRNSYERRNNTVKITDEQLKNEFDDWARNGWGEELELDNGFLVESTVKLMMLNPGTRVLDLSCGSGLATRMIAARFAAYPNPGVVTGIDISAEMLSLARRASEKHRNLNFVQGSADRIPVEDGYFDEVVCVESFYYYPDQDQALEEIYRVMSHGAYLYLVLRLYSDNPHADEFLSHLSIPAHVRSAAEYVAMLETHNFHMERTARLVERKSRRGGLPGVIERGLRLFTRKPTQWVPAIKEKIRVTRKRDRARGIGALLLVASKA